MTPTIYSAEEVETHLDYPGCIEAVRTAMSVLSRGPVQPLRTIVEVEPNRLFGLMPGTLAEAGYFGAKLVSVFPDASGRARHRGVVAVFAAASGDVICLADAETITEIRTACATAAASDALARQDAKTLAIFGLGLQAKSHIRALRQVRAFDRVLLWGRDPVRTRARAAALSHELSAEITPVEYAQEAAEADVICTVTGSPHPVLLGDWVQPGAHVNLVGSSYLGPVETDSTLVARARYIADYRPSALAQAAELAVARNAGLVTDDHVVGDIGQVFAGTLVGRQSPDQVTLYKSLGHIAQDLAAARYVHAQAQAQAR